MAAYNSRNNGGTAHLFGTTKKMGTMPRLGEPPAAERAAAQPQAMPMPAPTFAQMQSSGQARPAAPPQNRFTGGAFAPPGQMPVTSFTPMPGNAAAGRQVQSMQVGQGAPQAPGVTTAPVNPILQQIGNTLAGRGTTPSRFDTDLYKRLRDAALGDIEADFGARRQMLDEEMARRGLYSSSIAGGRMGDLEGQYARARTGLETDLLARAAETQMQDRIARDQMMMQLAQLLSGMKPADRTKFLAQLNPTGA
jgi:hypothetical protein